MITIQEALEAVRRAAPEELQESWDNSGVQILTDPGASVERILTCLEINDDVVEEAVRKKADLIVTHHPLFFSKLSSVRADDVVGAQTIRLIRHSISLYSAHTSFDSAAHGTNQDLAEKLGLEDIRPMYPSETDPAAGMGRYGIFEEPVSYDEFLQKVTDVCGQSLVRSAGRVPEMVRKAAICTGAGSEFMDDAFAGGADVYLTGDVKYHEARHAYDIGMCVIDAGHYGTEVLFAENMAGLLREGLGYHVEVLVSETDINPFVTDRERYCLITEQ